MFKRKSDFLDIVGQKLTVFKKKKTNSFGEGDFNFEELIKQRAIRDLMKQKTS